MDDQEDEPQPSTSYGQSSSKPSPLAQLSTNVESAPPTKRRNLNLDKENQPQPSTSYQSPSFAQSTSSDNSLVVSPPTKRKTRALTSTEKVMISNLFKHLHQELLQEEIDSSGLPPVMVTIKRATAAKKTAAYLGISQKSVYNVLKNKHLGHEFTDHKRTKTRLTVLDKLDDHELSVIRRKVHDFYHRNEAPTISKVLKAVNDDPDLPNLKWNSLRKVLKHLNFKYVTHSRRSALIDRQDIIQWRRKYLLQIKEYRRQGRPIYYQDETWLNAGHTLKKVWVDETVKTSRQAFLEGLSTGLKKPTGKGGRLIISHIGNEEGFVDGGLLMFESKSGKEDYHKDMNSQCFEEWLRGVLSKLKPNAVAVIDNAPYHSRKMDKYPTMSWTKAKIIEWINEKNISFPGTATKSDLITLAEPYKEDCNKYAVEEIAKEFNITILRLPPYHCELNPIELIWAQAKGYVARNNKTFKMKEVKQLFMDALNNITAERWKGCVEKTIKVEDEMMKLDHLTDDISDRFIIEVGDEDSDEEISDDSDDD